MKVIKTISVRENDLDTVVSQITNVIDKFDSNHPVRAMMVDARTKVQQTVRINRQDIQKVQNTYVYVVESSEGL